MAAALVVGQATLAVCGRGEPTALAGPVGLALLLVVAGIGAGPGDAGTVAILLGVVTAGAAVMLAVRAFRPRPGAGPLAAAALAALFAALPFIAAGDVGILGVGLVNDDMASHLLLADWVREGFRPEPVLVDQGYPLGPHALVAGLGTLLGAGSVEAFAGLILAIPALTALVAHSALDGLHPAPRIGASALVALPYLAAAYLAQEAFKEPVIALFLLAFALLLPDLRRPRDAIALGVLAAGSVYVYSFPGLAWFAGTALIWGALLALASRRAEIADRVGEIGPRRGGGAALGLAVAALAALVLLVLPDLERLRDFVDFRALDPDRANEGGLGNLPGQLSPLEAFGVWPTSEFRLSAAAGSLPAVVFYAGGLLAVGAFAAGFGRWLRRHGVAVPAALLACAILYLAALALGTVYTSAKALAIAAPLITLIALGGLLALPASRWRAVLGAAFAIAAALSSFLILRQAPVGPEAHAAELERIRPLVQGEKLLFLGRDNFILHELRGSKPFTHVRNFYDPYFVEPNFELRDVGSKFDFDSVTGETLARFPYVLTTRAAYASGPPPGYRVVAETPSYRLWEAGGLATERRLPGETGPEPGRRAGCEGDPRAVATLARAPVEAPAAAWSATTIESGGSATLRLDLPARGAWDLSLRYDSTRPLAVRAAGLETALPANLDYRGVAPFWDAGRIVVARPGPVTVTATIAEPPLVGRLLGADSVAHLGDLAATAARSGRDEGCAGYVDWYER